MSNDHLLLALDQNAKALDPLRGHTPLFAAIASLEDAGTADPFDALPRALQDYLRRTAGPVALTRPVPVSTGIGGHTYGLAVYAESAQGVGGREATDRAFRPLAERLSGLVREVPDAVLRRLGVGDPFAAPLYDWVWVLFQLAWHFPAHFARGLAHRQRLLTAGARTFVAPERCLQLDGVVGDARDIYPGVIFSRFPPALDLVTATGYAVDLLRRAIQGGGQFRVTDAVRDEVRRLHRQFAAAGRHHADLPAGPWGESEFRVLGLGNSFRTPPAAAWAGYQPAGPGQETLLLSHGGAAREVCVIGGPWVDDFTRLADRAGALLPAWPDWPAPALLADADTWLMRVARRRELQSEQYYVCTEDGSPPNGRPIPRAQMVEHYWTITRPSAGLGGLVTDHRGNVERWVGFVCHVLKEYDPDAADIRRVPEGGRRVHLHPNAILTFPGLNPYQASARAMELAGWVWPEPQDGGPGSLPPSAGADGPAARPRFEEEPPPTNNFPRPDAGRLVRFHQGDRSAEGEPEWRWAWAWAEPPGDGWVECGVVGHGVLIGMGRPPEACGWLPAEWPAGFFPLGGGPAHCEGWRSLVRSVLDGGSDTIPPDDARYGWLTLTRATRLLAHHRGLITTERLLAPLPASRDDARREAYPLLDGLVLVRAEPPGSSSARELPAAPFTEVAQKEQPPAGLGSEISQLLAEAMSGFALASPHLVIAAVPHRPGPDGETTPCRKCDQDAPDQGQIRDGTFYWPFRSLKVVGGGGCPTLGGFTFLLFGPDLAAVDAFDDFSRRAAAVLLAALPPWFTADRPGSGALVWAAATMFLSPSASRQVTVQPTGPRLLPNPWAASIAALRDILSPPAAGPADPGTSGAVVGSPPLAFDDPTWSVLTALRAIRPRLMKLVDIEAATSLSKQTVGVAVADLITRGLAVRPSGKRKGVGLTPAGVATVDALRNSSANHP